MSWAEDLVAALVDQRSSDSATLNASLGPFCTYRVGGSADVLVHADSVRTLEVVVEKTPGDIPFLVLGKGSNLLVADAGFPGVVVQLGDGFSEVSIDAEAAIVRAGGAALLPVVARRSAAAGLAGFEWAVGVPGSIGGAVRMNAGGHGSDMAASLVRVSVFNLKTGGPENRAVDELDLSYRHSNLGADEVVLFAELRLVHGDVEAAESEISQIVQWRRANQPGGQNAGSVFANPPGDSAGRLIDAAGLKGLRIGSAAISEKHANFIQAEPDGSADDIRSVILEVQRLVLQRFGVHLHPENRLIGFTEADS